MAKYPDTFPCIQIGGYDLQADSGVERTDMEGGNIRQRRRYRSIPHTVTLSFAIKISEFKAWQEWVNANAYDWFEMPLVSFLSGTGTQIPSPHTARFSSDIQVNSIQGTNEYLMVTVQAETGPISRFEMPVPPTGCWIVARDPANPASNCWKIAGTPANAATSCIIRAGSPANPAAFV